MDINLNQLTDFSQNSTARDPLICENKDIAEDILNSEIEQDSGQVLPVDGKTSPIKLDFSALLEKEVTQELPTQEPVQIINQPEIKVFTDKEHEKKVMLSQALPLMANLTAPDNKGFADLTQKAQFLPEQTELMADNNQLTREDEKFISITNKSIILKEISTAETNQLQISNNEEQPDTLVQLADPIIFEQMLNKESKVKDKNVKEITQSLNIEAQKIHNANQKEILPMQFIKTPEFDVHAEKEQVPTLSVQDKPQETSDEQITFTMAEYQVNVSQVQAKQEQMAQGISEKPILRETFEQDLSQKVKMMINTNEHSATVEISPKELGNIEIKIVQEADKMHISFMASQFDTQQLIEASLDKLKHQVQMHGLDLGNVSVSYQNGSSQQNFAKNKGYQSASQGISLTTPTTILNTTRSPTSMLDIYA